MQAQCAILLDSTDSSTRQLSTGRWCSVSSLVNKSSIGAEGMHKVFCNMPQLHQAICLHICSLTVMSVKAYTAHVYMNALLPYILIYACCLYPRYVMLHTHVIAKAPASLPCSCEDCSPAFSWWVLVLLAICGASGRATEQPLLDYCLQSKQHAVHLTCKPCLKVDMFDISVWQLWLPIYQAQAVLAIFVLALLERILAMIIEVSIQ